MYMQDPPWPVKYGYVLRVLLFSTIAELFVFTKSQLAASYKQAVCLHGLQQNISFARDVTFTPNRLFTTDKLAIPCMVRNINPALTKNSAK